MKYIPLTKKHCKGEWANIMNKNSKSRNGLIHLYNPKKEGLGSYDIHYINAYQKDKNIKHSQNKSDNERCAA
tara:strand:- start:839 stop:1054 length:216 start_codon:yes stop_codon:yes gene_type:complete